MVTVPIRGVGSKGLVPDQPPYDIPLSTPSSGRNVRFFSGAALSPPEFKELGGAPRLTEPPRLLFRRVAESGVAEPHVLLDDGTIYTVAAGVYSQVHDGSLLGPLTSQATVDSLGGSYFVNNQAYAPVWLSPSASDYDIMSDWGVDDRCVSLRAYKDYLIALNVYKSSDSYPSMVKWSDTVQAGLAPNWDPATVGTNAGENVLNDNVGSLIDGCQLGNSFIIYGTQCVFRMDYIGGDFLFNFDRIFSEGGIMAPNCAVEKDMKHFVFGASDIYVHDGVTKFSISDNRVRRHVFSRLDTSRRDRCFVFLDDANSEVLFCYPTKADAAISVDDTVGCNEAAVYNFREDHWSIVDLPGVSSIASMSLTGVQTWDTMTDWPGSSWVALEGDPTEVAACSASLDGTNAIFFRDPRVNGLIPNSVTTAFSADGLLEFRVKDIDDLGVNLGAFKMLRSLTPQIETNEDTETVSIQCGSSLSPLSGYTFEEARTFNPWNQTKHDSRVNGRYVSFRIDIPASTWFRLSGFDMDLLSISRRG